MLQTRLSFTIKEPLPRDCFLLYLGERYRYPSVTDVSWIKQIDDHEYIIAVSHRYACKVYTYRINITTQEYTCIDSSVCNYKGKNFQTETMLYLPHGCTKKQPQLLIGTLSSVFFIYTIQPNFTLSFDSILNSSIDGNFHGLDKWNQYIYFSPSLMPKNHKNGIVQYDCTNSSFHLIETPDLDNNRLKDCKRLQLNRFVICINEQFSKTSMHQKNHSTKGWISFYDYSDDKMTLLVKQECGECHFDCCDAIQIDSQTIVCLVTCANLEGGRICKCVIKNDQLIEYSEIKVDDFPHGIDILGVFTTTKEGKEGEKGETYIRFAMTSYKTDKVYIQDLQL